MAPVTKLLGQVVKRRAPTARFDFSTVYWELQVYAPDGVLFERWTRMTASQATCKCGALYERAEFHSASREADRSFVCHSWVMACFDP